MLAREYLSSRNQKKETVRRGRIQHVPEEDALVVVDPAQPVPERYGGIGLPMGEFPEIISSSRRDFCTNGVPFAGASSLAVREGGAQKADISCGLSAGAALGVYINGELCHYELLFVINP